MTLGQHTQRFKHQVCSYQRCAAGRIERRRYFHNICANKAGPSQLAQKHLRLSHGKPARLEAAGTWCDAGIERVNIDT